MAYIVFPAEVLSPMRNDGNKKSPSVKRTVGMLLLLLLGIAFAFFLGYVLYILKLL